MNYRIKIYLMGGGFITYDRVEMIQDTDHYLVIELEGGKKIYVANNQVYYFEYEEEKRDETKIRNVRRRN